MPDEQIHISRIEAIPFSIPYRKSFVMSQTTMNTADHVLVRITSSDGLVGLSEAPARPVVYGETQASIVAVIDQLFAPMLLDSGTVNPALAWAQTSQIKNNNCARGALNLALWDLVAKHREISMASHMHCISDTVAACSMLSVSAEEESLAEAQRLRDTYGVTAFKIKLGHDTRSDVRSLARLRTEFGPDAVLYADGNCGLTVEAAKYFISAANELGLAYVEDLVPLYEHQAIRELIRRADMPVLCDEGAIDSHEVLQKLRDGLATAVTVKTARTGLSESRSVAAICDAFGVPWVVGSQGDSAIGAVAGATFAAMRTGAATHPAEVMFFDELEGQVTTEIPRIVNGQFPVRREVAGFGVEIDDAALERYRCDV